MEIGKVKIESSWRRELRLAVRQDRRNSSKIEFWNPCKLELFDFEALLLKCHTRKAIRPGTPQATEDRPCEAVAIGPGPRGLGLRDEVIGIAVSETEKPVDTHAQPSRRHRHEPHRRLAKSRRLL